MELVLPMYNVHPYFSLKNVGNKVSKIHGKIRYFGCTAHTWGACDFTACPPTSSSGYLQMIAAERLSLQPFKLAPLSGTSAWAFFP